jgi:magnesium-transporting ATPase (P-type)
VVGAVEHRGAVELRDFDPEERTDLLLRHLGTRHEGLSEREAARRLEQHGSNEIRRREGGGHLGTLLRQFTHPLVLLIWAAAVLAFVGDTAPLAVAIVAVIFLNAVFAFVQELQAEKATEADTGRMVHWRGSGGSSHAGSLLTSSSTTHLTQLYPR